MWYGSGSHVSSVVEVSDDLGRGDGAKLLEGVAQRVVIDRVVQILHVQIHTLVPLDTLLLQLVVLGLQFALALRLLLRSPAVE